MYVMKLVHCDTNQWQYDEKKWILLKNSDVENTFSVVIPLEGRTASPPHRLTKPAE